MLDTPVPFTERPLARPTFTVAMDLVQRAAKLRDVDPNRIVRPDRSAKVVKARWGVMWVLRRFGLRHARIAQLLGLRDHSTVIHGLHKTDELRKADADFRSFTDQLMAYAQLLEPRAERTEAA